MIERITERSHNQVRIFAPAKINLFLAVSGKRADGYHDLTTILGKLSIGDTLELRRGETGKGINLKCPEFEDLENDQNLVCQAAKKWFQKTGENWPVDILLDKKIPPLSGLGGGSSDAVSALFAINELGDKKLSIDELIELSAEIGSDCPSFFQSGLCIAQGRGEFVRSMDQAVAQNLIGQNILLFRPNLGLATVEGYQKLSENKNYSSVAWINTRIKDWENNLLSTTDFLHNDLERPVFHKHRYFPAMFDQLKASFGLIPRMSGSGSCCFLLIPDGFDQVSDLKSKIFLAWGKDAWVQSAQIIN